MAADTSLLPGPTISHYLIISARFFLRADARPPLINPLGGGHRPPFRSFGGGGPQAPTFSFPIELNTNLSLLLFCTLVLRAQSRIDLPLSGQRGKKIIIKIKIIEKFNFSIVEQICRTRAKPQQIVATRLLYCLQYPVPIQVVCKGFTPAHMMIAIHGRTTKTFPSWQPCPPNVVHEQSSILTQLTCAGPTSSFLARILA